MLSVGEVLLSLFDRIYIINLVHREDRRREMEAELRRIGLSLDHPAIELFPASCPDDKGSFPTRGTRGCFESHLNVHQAILAGGVNRALILEDDASFAPDFGALLALVSADLRRLDWDMFYSVAPLEKQQGDEEIGTQLLRLSPDHTFPVSHFIGFSRRCSERAVPYLKAIYARPPGDPEGGPMHVDGAYCWLRGAYPDFMVLGSRQPLAFQRSSRSDIADLQFWDRWPVIRLIVSAVRRSPALLGFLRRLR